MVREFQSRLIQLKKIKIHKKDSLLEAERLGFRIKSFLRSGFIAVRKSHTYKYPAGAPVELYALHLKMKMETEKSILVPPFLNPID